MITKGFYTMYEYPELGLPDLHKVKVVKIHQMNDGKTIVSYRYNWPFPITKELELLDFENLIAKPELEEEKK